MGVKSSSAGLKRTLAVAKLNNVVAAVVMTGRTKGVVEKKGLSGFKAGSALTSSTRGDLVGTNNKDSSRSAEVSSLTAKSGSSS